jgi:hypothetical protein
MLTQPIVTQAFGIAGQSMCVEKRVQNIAPTWQLISDVMVKLIKASITTVRQDKRVME